MQDQADQIKMAGDFTNIIDNAEVVQAEGEESMNPSAFIAKKKSSLKPPMQKPKKFTTKKVPDLKKGTNENGEDIQQVSKKQGKISILGMKKLLMTKSTNENKKRKPNEDNSSINCDNEIYRDRSTKQKMLRGD